MDNTGDGLQRPERALKRRPGPAFRKNLHFPVNAGYIRPDRCPRSRERAVRRRDYSDQPSR